MKIIYNKLIPFKGFAAINLFGVLFARKECKPLSERTINHEAIHTAQMRELLYVGFILDTSSNGYTGQSRQRRLTALSRLSARPTITKATSIIWMTDVFLPNGAKLKKNSYLCACDWWCNRSFSGVVFAKKHLRFLWFRQLIDKKKQNPRSKQL